ncbi:hypothetical protein E4T56_gene8683 [Termitomyces sp. T112]|nr:hypothetical protein E4T56_gene8683 [Termitomyces sp. T112]
MSPWPAPRLHPTTVNSVQFCQARHHILCPPEPPSSRVPPPLPGYNRWYISTTNNWEHFHMLLQIHESRGHSPLDAAGWLHFGEDAAEEPSSVAPSASAAPTEEGPLLSVAVATSTAAPLPSSSGASSKDAPSEKSMELGYANDPMFPVPVQLVTTPQAVPSPTEVVVATTIATPTAPEAGANGSSDTANTVLEHWADIVSNDEAEASKMDEQAG